MYKILLVMVMVILSGPPVFAELRGPGMGMGMRYGYGLGGCGDPELHLSPDQVEKVRRLQRHYLEEVRLLQRKFMLKRAELGMLNSGNSEEAPVVNRRQQEIQAIREKIRETWITYKIECRALLTSEQLEQLGSMERRPGHRHGMGWINR